MNICKKKRSISVSGVASILMFLSYAAYANSTELKTIELSIDNQITDSSNHNEAVSAAVRFGAGNSWTDEGTLSPGINGLLIPEQKSQEGIILITLSDGRRYAAPLPKPDQNNKIDIQLSTATNINENNKSQRLNQQEQYLLQSTTRETNTLFHKLSSNDKNLWLATCKTKVVLKTGHFNCEIKSKPLLQFTSTKVAGIGAKLTTISGTFSSSLMPDELAEKSTEGPKHSVHFKFVSAVQTVVTWGPINDMLATFTGSGVAAGIGKGRGVFTVEKSSD
ncbi:MAG: hypothetical protein ACRC5A_01235 [Enterobacteriaceae bacterium]